MASSDLFADEALSLIVEAGGSWWFGLLDAAPPANLASVSLIEDIPAVEVPRTAAGWVVASRAANPSEPIDLDTSALTVAVVPVAWCLFDDEARTLPRSAGRLAGAKVTPSIPLSVAAATVTIRFPASVAGLL